ncbi:MAG TPA: hypothetical protein VMS22_09155 [Candidatus Eisenbacteria bacterium]|nr:hypothetical protein [Candidatus Eisenbacteria bacterium]
MTPVHAAVLAVLVVASGADAALCRGKGGALFVREACKRRETPVVVPKGDQGPTGPSGPRVRAVDASGKAIGFINASGLVVVRQGDVALAMTATTDGFVPTGGLFFETTDCSGAGFVPFQYSTLYQRARVVGRTAYYTGEPLTDHLLKSVLAIQTPSACTTAGGTYNVLLDACCEPRTPFTEATGPALSLDLDAFTAPFHVEIER